MQVGDTILKRRLQKRKETQNFRRLGRVDPVVDFCSNDYLGLARNSDFQNAIYQVVKLQKASLVGSTGSRLLSGNSKFVEALEHRISTLHQSESATLFASGYLANLCLFSCIPQRGDTVLVDEDIHRSVHDGCQLNKAVKWKFKHNDLEDLRRLLTRAQGTCYVAVESLYSMDGSFAPLMEIATLCQEFNALLIVDEAHAFGVFGLGLIACYQLEQQVFATVITYGKAMGCHGAAVLGSRVLQQVIVNFGSPFIYSTSACLVQWIAIDQGYHFLEKNAGLAVLLQANIRLFNQLQAKPCEAWLSPIQSVIVPGNAAVKHKANQLLQEGIGVFPILYPTVGIGQERLRICIHSFNTQDEIRLLVNLLENETR